jgi:hypothetical protein
MEKRQISPQNQAESRVDPSGVSDGAAAKRRYEKPCVVRSLVPSVVMGGTGTKVELHPHQTHRRP